MPLLRHDEEVLVQPFAGLGEALNKPNLIVPHLQIVGLAFQELEVVAPIHVVVG